MAALALARLELRASGEPYFELPVDVAYAELLVARYSANPNLFEQPTILISSY